MQNSVKIISNICKRIEPYRSTKINPGSRYENLKLYVTRSEDANKQDCWRLGLLKMSYLIEVRGIQKM